MFSARRAPLMFLFVLLTSCGTSFEELRPDPLPLSKSDASPARTRVVIAPHPDRQPVPVSQDEFLAFMRRTVSQLPRTEEELRAVMLQTRQAAYLPNPRPPFQVVPVLGATVDPVTAALVQNYERWCGERGQGHDCSGALKGKPYLDAEGKYRIAFDIALQFNWAGFASEMRDFASFSTVKIVLLTGMVLYMATLALPELTTKFVAAAITMVLTAYLGAQAVWELVVGWIDLVKEVNVATTFGELRMAGERYGRRVGAQVARILIMVVTAAIAEGGLVARALNLPKAAAASTALATDSGGKLTIAGVGQVGGAVAAESGVTVALNPAQALAQGAVGVAMAARGTNTLPGAEGPCDEKPENHHIATVENSKSSLRGGPWTPRFEQIFEKAGLGLENAANKVRIKGHRGPHPLEYHQAVYERLGKAVRMCPTQATCRDSLLIALRELAEEIATPGSDLNKLVTRGCGE